MKKFLICIIIMVMLLSNAGCGMKDDKVSEEVDAQVDSKEGKKEAGKDNDKDISIGYTIIDECYESEDDGEYQAVNIHVPVIKEIEKLGIVEYYNELLGKELTDYESGILRIGEGDYYHLDYEIATMTNEMLSVVFRGERYLKNQAYPSEFIYTYNIDVKTGKTVCLAQKNENEKIAELLISGEELELVESEKTKEMKLQDYMQVLQSYSKKEWIEKLNTADISITQQEDGTLYEESRVSSVYSYMKDGKTILAIEVNHPLGDYVEILLP